MSAASDALVTAFDIYTYDRKDRFRAHIGQRGFSPRGSMMWEVFDPDSRAMRWIDTRLLHAKSMSLLLRAWSLLRQVA